MTTRSVSIVRIATRYIVDRRLDVGAEITIAFCKICAGPSEKDGVDEGDDHDICELSSKYG